jgi:hypothetical protein
MCIFSYRLSPVKLFFYLPYHFNELLNVSVPRTVRISFRCVMYSHCIMYYDTLLFTHIRLPLSVTEQTRTD